MNTPFPSPSYDDQNIFAKILRGEIPCHRVFEDEVALAFMDVMPQGDGHTLVIPKTPARTLLDISPDGLVALMPRGRVETSLLFGRHSAQ